MILYGSGVHHICFRFTVRRGTRAVRKIVPVMREGRHGSQKWPYSNRTRPNRQEWQEHCHRMPNRAGDGPCGSIPRPTVLNNLKCDYTTDPPCYFDAVHASPTSHHANPSTTIKSRIAKSLTPEPYNINHNEHGLCLCFMFRT